mmetsp:Transcript_5031/g.13843  ORF Transcript_5031/g.13843 Transcript_5031/m.13843 type:complete len:165 (+) Transcript_5031:1-495(+)
MAVSPSEPGSRNMETIRRAMAEGVLQRARGGDVGGAQGGKLPWNFATAAQGGMTRATPHPGYGGHGSGFNDALSASINLPGFAQEQASSRNHAAPDAGGALPLSEHATFPAPGGVEDADGGAYLETSQIQEILNGLNVQDMQSVLGDMDLDRQLGLSPSDETRA